MTAPRYAFYGRCSTEDEQDPTLSFPRQLGNARRRIGTDGVIVAHYYDIESGKLRYDARGGGHLDGFEIDIPRDGGLQDLLAAVTVQPRAFDRVIIESMSRLSRNSAVAFRIEEELSAAGVRLCCADEPLEESFGSIVLRHVNIGIARGYHHELMVKSRQGYETAASQGWHNGGIALYGYRFTIHQHPNPHKARTGQAKRTLELDPVRAPVVRRIYDEYLGGGKGIREIRDLLNSDPIRFPTRDAPDPTKAKGLWAGTSVWEVLRNPKYTGYQVWNRRRRKKDNATNPEADWIWSEEPSHPAIVSIDEWRAVQARAASNVRVRRARDAVNGTDESGRTEYLFRGLLLCGLCGLRMWGQRPTSRCYRCQPSHQRSSGIPADHPATVHIGEKALLRAVADWLSQAVFGPDRTEYWRKALAVSAQPRSGSAPASRIPEVEADIGDLQRRIDRQVESLESEDATPALRKRIADRVAALESTVEERRTLLAKLQAEASQEPATYDDIEAALRALPVIAADLAELPQTQLRQLFDSLGLVVRYHPEPRQIDLQVTLWRDEPGEETVRTKGRVGGRGKARPRNSGEVWLAPSVGFEPTHPAPEASALSPELRGQGRTH